MIPVDKARKKLKKLLKVAYCGEVAAALAYEGHRDSLVDDEEAQEEIEMIRLEELDHVHMLGEMLHRMGIYTIPKTRLWIFTKIGKIASFLCFHTGKRYPAIGAKLIERIGSVSYQEMAKLAEVCAPAYAEMDKKLLEMAKTEEEHEKYFDSFIKKLG